eukprot:tig00021128_g18894.t1
MSSALDEAAAAAAAAAATDWVVVSGGSELDVWSAASLEGARTAFVEAEFDATISALVSLAMGASSSTSEAGFFAAASELRQLKAHVMTLTRTLDASAASPRRRRDGRHLGNDGFVSVLTLCISMARRMRAAAEQLAEKRRGMMRIMLALEEKKLARRIGTYREQLGVFVQMAECAGIIARDAGQGGLFLAEEKKREHDMLSRVARISTIPFFGEAFGLQYEPPFRTFLRVIFLACASISRTVPLAGSMPLASAAAVAAAAESVDPPPPAPARSSNLFTSLFQRVSNDLLGPRIDLLQSTKAVMHGALFNIFPEQAAAQFEEAKARADVAFIRTFWNITEMPLVRTLSKLPLVQLACIDSFCIRPGPLRIWVRGSDEELVLQPPSLPPSVVADASGEPMPIRALYLCANPRTALLPSAALLAPCAYPPPAPPAVPVPLGAVELQPMGRSLGTELSPLPSRPAYPDDDEGAEPVPPTVAVEGEDEWEEVVAVAPAPPGPGSPRPRPRTPPPDLHRHPPASQQHVPPSTLAALDLEGATPRPTRPRPVRGARAGAPPPPPHHAHAARPPPRVQSLRGSAPAGPGQLSAGLIVHLHGGGFVAQTSCSHEGYLREWAKDTDAPIVSIDYRLAPEHPFPVPFEECYYAYTWALQNCRLLGSTGERVALVGDSAGGNLAAAIALRCAQEGTRGPDGLVLVYPALYLSDAPSPSRLLSVIDPMIPTSFLLRCLHSYVPPGVDPLSSPFLSPAVAPDELLAKLPPVYVTAGTLDPLLDDAVYFVRRLRALSRKVRFKIWYGFPHGFLNMGLAVPATRAAIKQCSYWLKEVLRVHIRLP